MEQHPEPGPADEPAGPLVLLVVVTGALGLLAGLFSAFATQLVWRDVPVGVALVVVGNAVVSGGLALGAAHVGPVLSYGAAWFVAMALLSTGRAGGDIVITAQGRSLVAVFGGGLAIATGLVLAARLPTSPGGGTGR